MDKVDSPHIEWQEGNGESVEIGYLVPERKPSFSPISVSGSNFNPQNTSRMPAVKIFAFLDLDEKSWFSFGHYLNPNGQQCYGHCGVAGTDHGQYAYKTECTCCGYVYGTNGTDMHERKCPECQKGAPGIRFWRIIEK